jgi:hypothetical protein
MMVQTATAIGEQARKLPRAERLLLLGTLADDLGLVDLNTVIGDIVASERDRELEEGVVQPMAREQMFDAIRARRR